MLDNDDKTFSASALLLGTTLKTARSDESPRVTALIQRFERLATSDWEPK